VLGILLLVLPLVSADYELSGLELCALFEMTEENCLALSNEYLCNYTLEHDWANTYYNAEGDTCVFIEEEAVEAPDLTQNLSDIEASVSSLNNRAAILEQRMAELETDFNSLSQQFANLYASFQSTSQQLESQFGDVSTGLAGLQEEVNVTQVELAEVGEAAATSSFLIYFILIVLIIAVAMGIYYYTVRKKTPPHDKLIKHISQHIKKGRPHHEIKEGLHQAGWSKSVVDWAHQKAVSSTVAKRNKIIAIVVGSVILIGVLLFMISGTTFGKAIWVDIESHEIELVCEEGKIMAPDGYSCCSDANNNSVCDIDEEYEAERAEEDAPICLDNRDCVVGKYCIDSECKFLHELSNYDCPNACEYISATISTISSNGSTSDEETYYPLIGRGGYTFAGALSWTLLDSPRFCSPNEVVLLIELVKTGTVIEQGRPKVIIINKKVITLAEDQSSNPITHPSVPGHSLILTVDDIHAPCG